MTSRGRMNPSFSISLALAALSWSSPAARLPSLMLMVMLFLRAVHICYSELLDQFWTCFKSIEMAAIDLVVEDIAYHDSFTVHECKGEGKPATSTPCIPVAASANTDQKGTVWQNPFEWISTSYSKKAIKTCWMHMIAGTGI